MLHLLIDSRLFITYQSYVIFFFGGGGGGKKKI